MNSEHNSKSVIKHHIPAQAHWRSLIALVLLLGTALLSGVPVSASAGEGRLPEVHVTYAIDRSAVPDWVTHRDVTFVVNVGPAWDVFALGDGEPALCEYDGEDARITTSASSVEMIVSGAARDLDDIGEPMLAALLGDKDWAFSLTLDDGYENQATTAKDLLDRYGYDATVAVIGARVGQVVAGKQYATAEQLQEIVDAGWALSNHTTSHLMVADLGTDADVVRDIRWANEAIDDAVPGYSPILFTAPFVDTEYVPIIKAHNDELNFRLVQTLAWEGRQVDEDAFRPDDTDPTTIGRTQLLHGGSQFDEAHSWVEAHPGTHWWLSLHSHAVADTCDCVETATDALYETYGAGGTDEVWVAPAPDVYEYVVARNRTEITETERVLQGDALQGLEPPERQEQQAPEIMVLQDGLAGYAGTIDASIDSYSPSQSNGATASMVVRSPGVKTGLIRFDLNSLPEGAAIERATLSLYALQQSNDAEVCLEAYPLQREWDETACTWLEAAEGSYWGLAGASGDDVDRSASYTGRRGLVMDTGVWYTLDLTQAVADWLVTPDENYGVALVGAGGTAKEFALASSEYSDVSVHPKLEIEYRVPPPAQPDLGQGDGILLGQLDMVGLGDRPSSRWSVPLRVALAQADDGAEVFSGELTAGKYGEFVIQGLLPGEYDMVVDADGALPVVRQGLVVVSGLNMTTIGPLVLGDITGDSVVSARDRYALQAAMGSLLDDGQYDEAADIDRDGAVDVLDLALLSEGYGRYGPIAQDAEPGESPDPLDTSIWVTPPQELGRPGDTILLDVMLDAGSGGVDGLDLSVSYDASALSLVQATAADLWSTTMPSTDLSGDDGVVRIVAADLGDGVDGEHALLHLAFEAVGTTDSTGARVGLSAESVPASRVLASGESVLVESRDARVVISDESALYLPMISRDSAGAAPSQDEQQRLAAFRAQHSLSTGVSLPIVGSLDLGNETFEARDVRVRDGYAYVTLATSYAYDELVYVVDISDATAPSLARVVRNSSYESDEIWLEGDLGFVSKKGGGVDILDLSYPPYVNVVMTFLWNDGIRPIAKGIHAVGDKLYIADEEYGLQVVDVSTPTEPRLVGSFDDATFGEGVWVSDGTAYVAAGRAGIRIIGVDSPSSPAPRTSDYVHVPGRSVDAQVGDSVLYVAAEDGGITAVDVSNPVAPEVLDTLDTFFAQKVDVVDDVVYVADDLGGLVVVDAGDPAALQPLAVCDTSGRSFGVSVANGYAYVADGVEGLKVVDLTLLTPTPTATPTLTPSATPTVTPTSTPSPTPTRLPMAIPLIYR